MLCYYPACSPSSDFSNCLLVSVLSSISPLAQIRPGFLPYRCLLSQPQAGNSLALSSMTLKVWKIVGQLFCWLSSGLSDESLRFDLGEACLAGTLLTRFTLSGMWCLSQLWSRALSSLREGGVREVPPLDGDLVLPRWDAMGVERVREGRVCNWHTERRDREVEGKREKTKGRESGVRDGTQIK